MVVITIISGLGEVEHRKWKENVEYLNRVNEYIKNKDLTDKELLYIYLKKKEIE